MVGRARQQENEAPGTSPRQLKSRAERKLGKPYNHEAYPQ